MKSRLPAGTVQQIVFDALLNGGLTLQGLEAVTGLTTFRIRNALFELNKQAKIGLCKQPTLYQIMPQALRPQDGRGRK